jgi:hypothetical protein
MRLRKLGHSVGEIAAMLSVSQGSVSLWVRSVALSAHAEAVLLRKAIVGREKGIEARRRFGRESRQGAVVRAREHLGAIPSVEHFDLVACALLYYCEGAKGTSTGVRFTNSSPLVMGRFIDLFRKSFIIDERRLRIGLHLHEYHVASRQIGFWARVLGIPRGQFIRPYLKPHTGKQKREGYPGCATVRYGSAEIARTLIATAEAYLG